MLIEEYFDKTKEITKYVNSNPGNEDMFDLQIKSLIRNINTIDSKVNMNDAIASMKIIEAAKESMQKNAVIKLNID